MSIKAFPQGSRVLVTGANGYIASHVADQLMSLGYTVRGTARDQQKVDSIGKTLRERNPSATFEGFVLSDVTAPGAFDKAVAGKCDTVHPRHLQSRTCGQVIRTNISNRQNATGSSISQQTFPSLQTRMRLSRKLSRVCAVFLTLQRRRA